MHLPAASSLATAYCSAAATAGTASTAATASTASTASTGSTGSNYTAVGTISSSTNVTVATGSPIAIFTGAAMTNKVGWTLGGVVAMGAALLQI